MQCCLPALREKGSLELRVEHKRSGTLLVLLIVSAGGRRRRRQQSRIAALCGAFEVNSHFSGCAAQWPVVRAPLTCQTRASYGGGGEQTEEQRTARVCARSASRSARLANST